MRIRLLGNDDLGALVALHRTILATLPDPSFLYARDADFFARVIDGGGAILGAFAENGTLAAYGALAAPGADYAGRPRVHGALALDLASVAFTTGSGVGPDYRRQGLIRRINIERAHIAARLGARFVAGVVLPVNHASLATLHGLGYAAIAIHHDEDGENFLMLAPTGSAFPPPVDMDRLVRLDDSAGNLAVLREERLIGLAVSRSALPLFAYVDPESVLVSEG